MVSGVFFSGADFLVLEVLRGFATPLCWARGTFGAGVGSRGCTAGRVLNRAERRRDMISRGKVELCAN